MKNDYRIMDLLNRYHLYLYSLGYSIKSINDNHCSITDYVNAVEYIAHLETMTIDELAKNINAVYSQYDKDGDKHNLLPHDNNNRTLNSLAASVFIMRLKKLIDKNKLYFKPRNRQKTMQFLFDEGLSVKDVMDYVKNLTPEDFYSGPTEDDNRSAGDVMVFFKPYKDTKLYIKLKIWCDAAGDAGVVMSFHKEGQYD